MSTQTYSADVEPPNSKASELSQYRIGNSFPTVVSAPNSFILVDNGGMASTVFQAYSAKEALESVQTYSSRIVSATLQHLTDLHLGWDGYDAPPPSRLSIVHAYDFASAALSISHTLVHMGASISGGVGFTFVNDPSDTECVVEIRNNGTTILTVVESDGTMSTRTFSTEDISWSKLIENLRSPLGIEDTPGNGTEWQTQD